MSFAIILDSAICLIGLILLIYYTTLCNRLFHRFALGVAFIGLGFQTLRNFGFLNNNLSGTIFDYGLPIWAFKELGLVLLLLAFLPIVRKGTLKE